MHRESVNTCTASLIPFSRERLAGVSDLNCKVPFALMYTFHVSWPQLCPVALRVSLKPLNTSLGSFSFIVPEQ